MCGYVRLAVVCIVCMRVRLAVDVYCIIFQRVFTEFGVDFAC